MSTVDLTDPLALINCVQQNLEHLRRLRPDLIRVAMFNLVQYQINEAETALIAERKKRNAQCRPG